MRIRIVVSLLLASFTTAHAQDAALLQREIDRAIAAKQPPVLRLKADTTYRIESPLNFRGYYEGAGIIGQGFGTVLESRITDRRAPMINMVGCTRATIRDVRILGGQPTNDANYYEPACGVLFARSPNNASSGWHVMDRVWIRGRFVLACVANFASEGNTIRECEFSNHEGPSKHIDGLPHGGHLLYFSNGDYHNWVNVPVGTSTMLTSWVRDCLIAKTPVRDEDARGVAIMIYSKEAAVVGDLHFEGLNSYSREQVATFGFDVPQVFTTDNKSRGGQTHIITIAASRFEEVTTDSLVIVRGGRELSGLTVRDSQVMTEGVPFDFGNVRGWRVTLENLRIVRIGDPIDQPERFYKSGRPLDETLGKFSQLEVHGWSTANVADVANSRG